jgi:hypothetical protein
MFPDQKNINRKHNMAKKKEKKECCKEKERLGQLSAVWGEQGEVDTPKPVLPVEYAVAWLRSVLFLVRFVAVCVVLVLRWEMARDFFLLLFLASKTKKLVAS